MTTIAEAHEKSFPFIPDKFGPFHIVAGSEVILETPSLSVAKNQL